MLHISSVRHCDSPILVNMTEYRSTHIDVKDAIAFAAIKMKEFYNVKHKLMFFKVGDLINL